MNHQINYRILVPPILVLTLILVVSLMDAEALVNLFNSWRVAVLSAFDWLFNLAVFSFVLVLIGIYFSPIGNVKIGGPGAKPILSKPRWFAIVLCTTVATGILFWGAAEPLFHLHEPPSLDYPATSPGAAKVAMSSLFMNWTIPPYALYTSVALLFGLSFYNLKRPFRVSSLVFDAKGSAVLKDALDALCLVALVGGMSASLGAGILTISGGLEQQFSLVQGPGLWAIITFFIVVAFVISAASGLQRGIKWLSQINVILFIILIIIFGSVLLNWEAIKLSLNGLLDFTIHFVPRSLGLSNFERSWEQSWMSFYWANWMAWAPVTALFLGRLGVGYTVREFIRINLIYTSLFSMFWLTIFAGISITHDLDTNYSLYEILKEGGPQDVIFNLVNLLPMSSVMAILFLIVVYISFVTAADSNTSAMSAMSSKNVDPENPEAPIILKIIWGSFVAMLAWIMISFSGIEGIKTISILGGFPILFLCIAVIVKLVKLVFSSEQLAVNS